MLWTAEATVIPPNYVGFVAVTPRDRGGVDIYIEPQVRMQEGREHCFLACVVGVSEEGVRVIPVMIVSTN